MAKLLYGSGLRLKDVKTTMIYTHVLKQGGVYRSAVRSPLD
jgi:hypothetical protein